MDINDVKDVNIIGFYHEYDEYGYFSNWYRAEFEYAGKRFSSVEQFMMYHKVMMFGQYSLGQAIMDSNDVAKIKKLGRTRFPEFNSKIWDETCYAIVKRGVRAKFEQNKDILEKLLSTENKILAECSENDKKWGIGVSINDAERFDPSCWNGKNYLGRILMEVRDDLKHAADAGKLGYKD
ncbi:MAG: NADAR family protein, partial [Clostridia bacterium]|nr:NADAR family protein [Clostridia bacterium]MBR5266467.1 NADAR family protein [Clostridia bacterium]